MLQTTAQLALFCLSVCGIYLLLQHYVHPSFWNFAPWHGLLEVQHLTEANVSDLLYCIGQESSLAHQNMSDLCALCGIAYPPAQDPTNSAPATTGCESPITTPPGQASVPINAAPPTKDH